MPIQTIIGFTWSTPLRKTITSVTLVAGMITAVNSAWPVVEPIAPAHRDFVRSTIRVKDDQMQRQETILRDLQIEHAEGKKDIADFELNRLQLELTKPHTDDEKLKLQQEIVKTQNTKAKLQEQIRTLKKLRSDID